MADASDDAKRDAVAALEVLGAVLHPHLREEEDDAMPVTAQLITAGEWHAIEEQHNLSGKTLSQLGFGATGSSTTPPRRTARW